MVEAPPPMPLFYQVQIIDTETNSEGLKPFVLYIILTRREGEGEAERNATMVGGNLSILFSVQQLLSRCLL